MEETPQVSVVMPAYNAQDTIGAAVSGVLTQTYPRVELVVVDDGSTDDTGAICRGYGDRLRYHRQHNAGSSVARNRAMDLASGELLAFCDADDVLLPRYLEAAVAAYRAAGGGRRIVMCDALQLTSTGLSHGRRLIGHHFPARRQRLAILQKNFVPIFAVFPRALVDEIGGFVEDLMFCEDWEFWIRAVLAGWEVVFQPEPEALYRLTPNAKSAQEERHEAEDEIMRRVRAQLWEELTAQEQEFLRLRLTTAPPRLLDLRASEALREHRWGDARSHYAELARLSSEDPSVRLRATLLSRVPGAVHLGRLRQDLIDRHLGGRIPSTPVRGSSR